ncbi:putative metalloprotease C21orf57-like protein [Martensiomyces pterosporus]|nr:putative metalloprotease C21orf57-like protein [Martensiomyces pterosporus]
MVLVVNQQRLIWLPLRTLRRQVELLLCCSGYSGWDIGVHFVDNRRIQELNRTYRHKDKPTDILSFPFHEVTVPEVDLPRTGNEDDMNLGDMFLSMPYIWEDCRVNGESPVDRLPVLFTHGICHLMGHDHELDEDYRKMSQREQEILRRFSQLK